jgi:hypothetical protein
MTQLDMLYDYKNQLMEDLLTDSEIVRLLEDDCNTVENPEDFVYTQVFPHEYIPDVIEHGQTFICFDVDITKSLSKTYLMPTLYIWAFCHKSKLRLPDGGVRTDRLCSEIARCINGSRDYGLGELNLYSVKRFAPLADYQGKVMTFQATDFNRLSPSGKSVPANRKTG